MNIWVVKYSDFNREVGHLEWEFWEHYFDTEYDEVVTVPLTPEDVMFDGQARRLVEREMRKGDVVVCFQAEGERIMGLTVVASGTELPSDDSDDEVLFAVISSYDAYPFDPPLTIEQVEDGRTRIDCLSNSAKDSIRQMSVSEFQGLLDVVSQELPHETEELEVWLKDHGCEWEFPSIDDASGEGMGTAADRSEKHAGDIDAVLDELEERLSERSNTYVKRFMRQLTRKDGELVRAIKAQYGHRCQFPGCKATIPKRDGGLYCEVAHILPVARGGGANRVNLVVLCPNHHKMFDYGDLQIAICNRQVIEGTLNGMCFTIRR